MIFLIHLYLKMDSSKKLRNLNLTFPNLNSYLNVRIVMQYYSTHIALPPAVGQLISVPLP